ncbi:MAG: DoxX family protein [Gammaproteobacteria bacterium]|nr:DoxX family protein [Gammaproteobacteria bacterium]
MPRFTTTQRRTLWGARMLLALVFGVAGAAKLAGTPQMVAMFDAINWGHWFRYLTGSVEILGAVMLLIPATSFAALLLLGGTMVGALLAHLLAVPGSPIPAIVLGGLCAGMAWVLRPRLFRDRVRR